MLDRIYIVVLCLGLSVVSEAQVCFNGTVLSGEDSTAVSFASVCMSEHNGIAKNTTLTDLYGKYTIQSLKTGRYRVTISSVGYETLDTLINVRYPSVGNNTVSKCFVLIPCDNMLDEVEVRGTTITHGIDQHRYLVTRNDLRNAVSAVDLVRKISGVDYDVATGKVVSFRGGNIKILINGVSASENDLQAIDADQIKQIVHYDFPPAKYAGYSAVVNFITKERKSGLNAGASATQALATGYTNGMVFFKYNHGYDQIGIEANTSYRNYTDFDVLNSYEYSLNGKDYTSTIHGRRKFGYDDNYIQLSYNRNVPDKYQMNIAFSPNFQHVRLDEKQDNVFSVDGIACRRDGTVYSRSKQFTPSLDIYTNIQLRHQQELTFNIVGSLISADKVYNKVEKCKAESVYADDNIQENSKHSVIGELSYRKRFKNGFSMSWTDRFSYGRLSASVSNGFTDPEYKTRMTTNYVAGEIEGSIGRFMFRASAGLTYYDNRNDECSYSSMAFEPMLFAGWNVNKRMTVRGVFSRTSTMPTLSQLSSNKFLINENIISQGNPELRNSTSNVLAVMLSYTQPWVNTELVLGYATQKDAINSYFVQECDFICQKYENAARERSYFAEGSLVFKPFPKSDILSLKLSALFEHDCVESGFVGKYSYNQVPIDCSITFNYKKVQASYTGNILTWELNSPYLEKKEKVSTLTVRYNPVKNLSLSANVLWLGRPAEYRSKTIDGSVVSYHGMTNIHDNMNMITVGISYRFSTGRKYINKEKAIRNADKDSGIN